MSTMKPAQKERGVACWHCSRRRSLKRVARRFGPCQRVRRDRLQRTVIRIALSDQIREFKGHSAPEPGPYDFSIQGHSVGRYEGDQLVVETTKFVFDPVGLADTGNIPSSTLKTVTERYWREGDWLKANVVTEDPLILMAPYEFTFQWELTDVALVPYGCDPELARFPAEFFPSKYQDPDWVRLPADRPSIRP